MFKSVTLLFNKLNEIECRIYNFDEILFIPKVIENRFFTPRKSHALNGRSDATPRILTLERGGDRSANQLLYGEDVRDILRNFQEIQSRHSI